MDGSCADGRQPPGRDGGGFYLKGVSPPQASLNQIFAGMLPYMAIQVIAIVLLYLFPGIGPWLRSCSIGRG
jgi:TRAP-type mannitol/chloroaromatic compound transport system permease large subunit